MARDTYRVRPLPDGVDMRGNWQVTRNGKRVSRHVKKSAAKREARREASVGDVIIHHRTDGQVHDRFVVRKASVSGSDGDSGKGLYFGPWDRDHDDPFFGG